VSSRIILFELNEVPFRIIDEFVRWRPTSTFAQLLPVSRQYRTQAEDVGRLSPWKTWPSLHRGVTNREHAINDFGQDLSKVDHEYPSLWSLLAASGIMVGVCGSLHTYPLPTRSANYAFLLPDTFASGPEAWPPELATFQDFNLAVAGRSGRNVSVHIPWKQAATMLKNSQALGLTASTLLGVTGQVVTERIIRWRRVRRRTFQSLLAFDTFMAQLERTRPEFATFFTNHVASTLHRYWAARFPGDYDRVYHEERWTDRGGPTAIAAKSSGRCCKPTGYWGVS
jgi:hypothetical protein